MTTYTARYEQDDDGNWVVELDEEPGVHSWSRSLSTARANIREAAELWLDSDEADVVDVYPGWVDEAVADAVEARRAADEVVAAAADATLHAVQALSDRGMSRRDVADLLGISYQRVQQLVAPSSQAKASA